MIGVIALSNEKRNGQEFTEVLCALQASSNSVDYHEILTFEC
jgi:hypothetical protein